MAIINDIMKDIEYRWNRGVYVKPMIRRVLEKHLKQLKEEQKEVDKIFGPQGIDGTKVKIVD